MARGDLTDGVSTGGFAATGRAWPLGSSRDGTTALSERHALRAAGRLPFTSKIARSTPAQTVKDTLLASFSLAERRPTTRRLMN